MNVVDAPQGGADSSSRAVVPVEVTATAYTPEGEGPRDIVDVGGWPFFEVDIAKMHELDAGEAPTEEVLTDYVPGQWYSNNAVYLFVRKDGKVFMSPITDKLAEEAGDTRTVTDIQTDVMRALEAPGGLALERKYMDVPLSQHLVEVGSDEASVQTSLGMAMLEFVRRQKRKSGNGD